MTTGNNSATDFFHSTLVYSGLKTASSQVPDKAAIAVEGPPGGRPPEGLFPLAFSWPPAGVARLGAGVDGQWIRDFAFS